MSTQLPTVPITCECGKRLRARQSQAGHTVRCPHCGSSVAVPSGPPSAPSKPPIIEADRETNTLANDQAETSGTTALPISAIDRENETTHGPTVPPELTPTHRRNDARLPLILSTTAVAFSVIACVVPLLHDPLGKGLRAFDFSTPKDALISHLKLDANPDIRASIELAQLQRNNQAQEKLETLKIHKESTYQGGKLLFISFEKNGITNYAVEGMTKDADTGWWFPRHVTPFSIDDATLQNAVRDWQARSGRIESDE